MRKALLAVLLIVIAAPANAALWDVQVVNLSFQPDPLTIGLGDTVRWTWASGFHSTTSDPGQSEIWDSGEHGLPFSYDHTFTHLGSFRYYCSVHGAPNGQGMSGAVAVVPEPTSLLAMATFVGAGLLNRRRRGHP